MFAALQEVEERRVGGLRAAVAGAARAEKEVLPIVGQCLDGAQRAAEAIDEKEVKRLLRECRAVFRRFGGLIGLHFSLQNWFFAIEKRKGLSCPFLSILHSRYPV